MRSATTVLLLTRIAYGVGLIAAPERLTRRWLGRAVRRGPTQVALRALGMREIGLHAGALQALAAGRPVRPWLWASIAGDLTDVVATAVVRRQLPGGAAPATLAVGGGSACLTLAVLAGNR